MTGNLTKISLWARCMHCLSHRTVKHSFLCACVCECVYALACVLSEDNFRGLVLIFQLVLRRGLSF